MLSGPASFPLRRNGCRLRKPERLEDPEALRKGVYPAAVIRGRFLRGVGPSPCLGEILHHVAVGHVLQDLGIAGLVQHPAGDGRRYEVDELRSD